jgi:hypothetical protein
MIPDHSSYVGKSAEELIDQLWLMAGDEALENAKKYVVLREAIAFIDEVRRAK